MMAVLSESREGEAGRVYSWSNSCDNVIFGLNELREPCLLGKHTTGERGENEDECEILHKGHHFEENEEFRGLLTCSFIYCRIDHLAGLLDFIGGDIERRRNADGRVTEQEPVGDEPCLHTLSDHLMHQIPVAKFQGQQKPCPRISLIAG